MYLYILLTSDNVKLHRVLSFTGDMYMLYDILYHMIDWLMDWTSPPTQCFFSMFLCYSAAICQLCFLQ